MGLGWEKIMVVVSPLDSVTVGTLERLIVGRVCGKKVEPVAN